MILKPLLSKINFVLGRNPKIEKKISNIEFIPEPYKTVVLIQADFELAWAWRYTKSSSTPLNKAKAKASLARKNIPEILKLAQQYSIPITWATVGHLFLESCSCENDLPHPEIKRPSNFENEFWRFSGKDWFEHDPCTNIDNDPSWYGSDLIGQITKAHPKHEIACHTYSHIDCSDEKCSTEVIKSELLACKKEAKKKEINLNTFVHPGNIIGNLTTIRDMGFTSFRSTKKNTLGIPKKHKTGIWELKSTMGMRLREDWSIRYHKYRYKKIIDRAIKNQRLCLLWFHPSLDNKFVKTVMPDIFNYIHKNKNSIFITTTEDYINWLNFKQ